MILEINNPKYSSYLTDESQIKGDFYDIAFPENENDVRDIISLSLSENKNITFQGGRTGLWGGAVPKGERVVNLSNFKSNNEPFINDEKAEITVQCGDVFADVVKLVERKGFRFTVNPTEETATLGGMYSTNAEGPNSLYFKRFSNCVKTIDFTDLNGCNYHINRGEYVEKNGVLILPNGKELDFNNLSDNLPFTFYERGIDLIDFFAGKEGYLGAVTSLTLKLVKEPKDIWGVVFFFKDSEVSLEFGDKLKEYKNKNVIITTCEYFSEGALNLIKDNINNPLLSKLPEISENSRAAIYIEMESDDEGLSTDALMELLEAFSEMGGDEDNTWAQNGKSQIKPFRDMRHAVVSILNENVKIHCSEMGSRYETDFSLPNKDFKEYVNIYENALKTNSIKGLIYGSLLKNHLHLAFLGETNKDQEIAERVITELSKKVAADGGKIACKYGVGKAKIELVKNLLSDSDKVEIKKIIKIFNPNF